MARGSAAVQRFIANHFTCKDVLPARPGLGGRPKKDQVEAAAPKAAAKAAVHSSKEFKCKTCGVTFKDVSNARALAHILLVPKEGVRTCSNPQVTAQELTALKNEHVKKAENYNDRLQALQSLDKIGQDQPLLTGTEGQDDAFQPAVLKTLQTMQVKAALSKGQFAVHPETNEDYQQFLMTLCPKYRPPTKHEIWAIREELHVERLKERDHMIKALGVGGIVTDGCRGKGYESLINFLFVDGLTGTPVYWDTIDMGEKTKDGPALAEAILAVVTEMRAVCGDDQKVRTLVTDRTKANKVSWKLLEEHGVTGGADAVHVHASMIGDVYKAVPWLEESFQKGFKAIDFFRKRAKVLADFRKYQHEAGLKPLSFVKARFERLGSKYTMTRRLLKLQKVLKPYIHKRRFKQVARPSDELNVRACGSALRPTFPKRFLTLFLAFSVSSAAPSRDCI